MSKIFNVYFNSTQKKLATTIMLIFYRFESYITNRTIMQFSYERTHQFLAQVQFSPFNRWNPTQP